MEQPFHQSIAYYNDKTRETGFFDFEWFYIIKKGNYNHTHDLRQNAS